MKKLSLILSILLVACSTKKDVEPQKEQIQTQNGSMIGIYYTSGQIGLGRASSIPEEQKYLRVITRGHTAGQAAFNGIVGGILCNPLSLFGCSWRHLGFSREQLTGEITKVPNIIASYAYPKYIELLKQKLNFTEKKDYSVTPIFFYPADNFLVYDDDDNYKLYAGFQIYVSGSRVDGAFKCNETKSGISYDKWVENNYALAIEEGKKLVDKCFERLDKSHFENLQEQLIQERKQFL